jgi:2-phospho-L-lactate guanylyltransferase (CobY/MobA/RfbA family)
MGLQGLLVPSLDGTGTNAVYRSPPTLFPSRFGPGSLAAHEASLVALGVPYAVLRLESLALDLDDPGDVAALLRAGTACPARDYLLSIGAGERVAGLTREGA